MSKIDFSRIEELLKSSHDFTLTETQYKTITGRNMPKNTSYLIHSSALSRFAASLGMKIKVHEKAISFEKAP